MLRNSIIPRLRQIAVKIGIKKHLFQLSEAEVIDIPCDPANRLNQLQAWTGEKVFYFCHIPKTSGTTLTKLLESNFPHDAIYAPYFQNELWNKDLDAREKLLVRGHFISSKQFRLGSEEVHLLTILRDPAQRFYSQIKHQQRLQAGDRDRGGTGLTRTNLQTYWLAAEALYPIARDTLWDLPKEQVFDTAVNVLQSAYWVGIVERQLESVLLLMAMNGWRPANLSMREMVAPDRQHLQADDGHMNFIKELHDLDTRLYEVGNAVLDQRIASFLESANYRQARRGDSLTAVEQILGDALVTCPTLVSELANEETIRGQLYRMAILAYFSRLEQSCAIPSGKVGLMASDPFCGEGWHRREWAPEVEPYRWSGPDLVSDIHLPFRLTGRVEIKIHVNAWHDRLKPGTLQIKLNGVPVLMKEQHFLRIPGCLLVGEAILPEEWPFPFAMLEFSVSETRRLCDFADTPDTRSVGFSFKAIELSTS